MFFLKINTFKSFNGLEWSILLKGGVYLIINACNYFIIPIRNELIRLLYLIAYVIFFYQLNYCFLLSSVICKEYREY